MESVRAPKEAGCWLGLGQGLDVADEAIGQVQVWNHI